MGLWQSSPADLLRPREAERELVRLWRPRRLLRRFAVQSAVGPPPSQLREFQDWPGSRGPHSAHLVALRLDAWRQRQPQLVGWQLRPPALPDVQKLLLFSPAVCRLVGRTPRVDMPLPAAQAQLLQPKGPLPPAELVLRHRLSPARV